jgi:hypothetical protein
MQAGLGSMTMLRLAVVALLASQSFHREGSMPAHLRVYPQELPTESSAPSVHLRLGDLFPLLAQAHRGNYLWLNDFEDDEVVISEDLYEVLRSFRAYRPSA